jgi:hypothetical protein
MSNENTVEIYRKKTGAEGWFFRGETLITKLFTVFYSFCNLEKSIMPEIDVDINKKLHEELFDKLKERRTNII